MFTVIGLLIGGIAVFMIASLILGGLRGPPADPTDPMPPREPGDDKP